MTEPTIGLEEQRYTQALLAAQLLMAEVAAEQERVEDRQAKMERVTAMIRSDFEALAGEGSPRDVLAEHAASLDESGRIALLVEAYFLDPFAPYTLRRLRKQRREGAMAVATAMGADRELVRRIGEAAQSAKDSHTRRSWGRAGLIGIGAAVILGIGGFVAAPMVGAALGAGAGLSGAAATAHGLALLGGGALAAGGAGVAGGMWVVAGTAAATGVLAGGGGTALYQLGAAQARGELLKLQVTFKVAVLGVQSDLAEAQLIIGRLTDQADDLRARIEVERTLNDRNSKRVADLEQSLEAIEETVKWMGHETGAVA